MRSLQKGAAALVGAILLAGGSAVPALAAERQVKLTDLSFSSLCEIGGGVYYRGTHAQYCFYPDGTIVVCYDELGCRTYKPEKNGDPGASTSTVGAQKAL